VIKTDVLVIGGGIGGVSAGYYLAQGRRVLLVEQESSLAYHTTGRSAALYFENYGAKPIRPLSRASRGFFENPPDGLTDVPLLSPRGALWIGRPDQIPALDQVEREGQATGVAINRLTADQAAARVPCLRTDYLGGAVEEPEAQDMDVAAIHQSYVRGMRARGAQIHTSAPLARLAPEAGRWVAEAGDERIGADVVVNAAGAWCDVVAQLAGLAPLGLQPYRRTAFMVAGSDQWTNWPLVVDVHHHFYFKPDGVQLLCSLAEEKPSPPEDVRPEEIDIALAIERINAATTLEIRSIRSAWTGLRSFVPDRSMVIGFDPMAPGFFWLAGQGGTGIQTAPAAGQLTAALIESGHAPSELLDLGLDPDLLSPARFRITRDAGL
jgi:D-arginine dehydrogenase